MRVLILTVTAGQGHNQVASSLCEHLRAVGTEAISMDALEYITPVLKEVVSKGYLMSTKRLPKAYGKVYRLAEKRDSEEKEGVLLTVTTNILSKKLVRFVEEYKPDVIVCTHVFASMLMRDISDKIDKNIKTVGIITDFTIHPFWEDTTMDYYITANELLSNQAMKKGIDAEKIVPIGIPIHPKFVMKTDKRKARQMLGLDESMNTILVMSGSMGYGKVGKMVEEIDKSELSFQIVSVCGHNERLKKKIDKSEFKHPVYNYGFTNKVDLMMDAADCIVTKPGGLTTSEALAKGVPMLMANPIPGQEDRNVEFLLNNGAALKVSSTFPVDEAIYQLFSNETREETLREIVSVLGKPNSTRDFIEFIKKICEK